MSRFGSTAIIAWEAGTFLNPEEEAVDEENMPQFPFEESRESDVVQYRSLGGNVFQYQNYNKKVYSFNWSNLQESFKNTLTNMADQLPWFSFRSTHDGVTTDFGTFVMKPNSFSAQETTFELYDVSFEAEEAA